MKTKLKRRSVLAMGGAAAVGAVAGREAVINGVLGPEARAQTGAAADAYPRGRKPEAIVDGNYPASYFPNTELLGPDEIRLTALGTGMPNQTKRAVSISYLCELGNGDKFLFDMGLGSMGNLFSLRPDFSKLDKVFASHLHIDHVGDFMGLHIGGWLSGTLHADPHLRADRDRRPELGHQGLRRRHEEGLRMGPADPHRGAAGQGRRRSSSTSSTTSRKTVVYQENGVTIRSWPAIHSLDGSVSYSLEWNGLKYVFGGDTYPNKWYIKYAADARMWPPTSASCRRRRWRPTSAGIWPRRLTCRRGFTPSPRPSARSCRR